MIAGSLALDTNALRDIVAGDGAILAAVGDAELLLPVVALEETLYGWVLRVRKAHQGSREDLVGIALGYLGDVYRLSEWIPVLPYTPDAQEIYRQLRVGRGNRGKQDLRIAAICLAHQVPLLTRNRSDFDDIEGLSLVGW